jgi:hypothetical protein
MATTQSNCIRLQTSPPATRIEPGMLVTTVTSRRPTPSRQPLPRAATLFPMPKEPEDARLTGGTRSLDRRLLALNLLGSLPRPALAMPAPAPERIALPQQSSAA